jgi:hypothetical protein
MLISYPLKKLQTKSSEKCYEEKSYEIMEFLHVLYFYHNLCLLIFLLPFCEFFDSFEISIKFSVY